MLSTPAASPAWIVRCAPARSSSAMRRGVPVGREADLRAGQVEADDAGVAVADDEPGHLVPAVGLAHGAQQRADPDRRPGRGGLGAAGREAVEDRLHGLLDRGALRGQQLRRHPDLGVDDAVGGQVQRALAGHPAHRLGPLHHPDGVREGLQVADQRAGVGGLPEPGAEGLGVTGGQLPVADLVGQLEHRLRSQPAVQVVVQEHLRRAPQLLGRWGLAIGVRGISRSPCPASGRCGRTAPAPRRTTGPARARRAPAPSCRPAPRRPARRAGTPTAGPAPST